MAIADHLGVSSDMAASRYESAIAAIRDSFTGGLLCKQISERFRKRCEIEIREVLNNLPMTDDVSTLEKMHVAGLTSVHQSLAPASIFAQERATVESALVAEEAIFLKVVPSKGILGALAQKLDVSRDRYVQLAEEALIATPGSKLEALGRALADALDGLLPCRLAPAPTKPE